MGTIARLNTAKKKLAQAEQAMPGAYQNNYTDSINQKLGQLADASLTGSTGVDTDALNAAYQQYRANSVANAQNGAAAAAGTANTLAGGYGADWAKTAANQAAGEQIAGVDNSLSSLRADALQNWKQKMSDTTSVLDDLLGQQSLERREYDGAVSNAQNWRDYLSGRVDTARQENSDFWNNVWTGIKGVGSAALSAYDAYQGYSTQKMNAISKAEEMYRNGNVDGAKAVLKMYRMDENMFDNLQGVSNVTTQQIAAAKDIYSLLQAGAPEEMISYYCNQYGIDPEIYKNWAGLSDVDKTNLDYLMKAGDYITAGNEGVGNTILSRLPYGTGASDTFSTIAGRLTSQQTATQEALYRLQKKWGVGTGSKSGSSGSGSGNASGTKYTSSNITSLLGKLAGMSQKDPMYSVIAGELQKAGVPMDTILGTGSTGTKASTQSAAGGTGAGKAGTTTSKLPVATAKTPWSTSGTVDGVAGASVSMASPKGGNYNTALREAQQMANNGYDMAQITEYLIRKNYSDSTISQVSQTMGW